MTNEIKIFFDKNGTPIKAGDILYREFYARRRERPGARKVAINSMTGVEQIVSDEGALLPSNGEKHWITRKVKWMGACLIAERIDCSDFQVLMQWEKFDENNESVCESSAFDYFNEVYDCTRYEIKNDNK